MINFLTPNKNAAEAAFLAGVLNLITPAPGVYMTHGAMRLVAWT